MNDDAPCASRAVLLLGPTGAGKSPLGDWRAARGLRNCLKSGMKAGCHRKSATNTNPRGPRQLTSINNHAIGAAMKAAKSTPEKKSPGTTMVEKYRPRMNKLSDAERQRLVDRAMQIAYGAENQPAGSRRR